MAKSRKELKEKIKSLKGRISIQAHNIRIYKEYEDKCVKLEKENAELKEQTKKLKLALVELASATENIVAEKNHEIEEMRARSII